METMDLETVEMEAAADWESAEPSAADLESGIVPDIELDYETETAAALEPDYASRAAAAARRSAIRSAAAVVPGSAAVRLAVHHLNVIAGRRSAAAVIGDSASIESVETVVDVTGTARAVSYPLVVVESVDSVLVFPVRWTDRVASLMDAAEAAHAEALGALDESDPETLHAVTVTGERLERLEARYAPRPLAWDGSAEGMVSLLKANAPHRVGVIRHLGFIAPRMRRTQAANRATQKAQKDVAMAEAIDRAMGLTDSTDMDGVATLRPTVELAYAGYRLDMKDAASAERMAARWAGKGLTADNILALEAWVSAGETAKARERRRAQARARVEAGKDWAPRGYAVQGTDVATARLINSIKRAV